MTKLRHRPLDRKTRDTKCLHRCFRQGRGNCYLTRGWTFFGEGARLSPSLQHYANRACNFGIHGFIWNRYRFISLQGQVWAAEVIVRGQRVPRLARLMILFLSCLNELYSYLSDLDDTSRSPVIYDFRASTCILRPHSWECTSMHLQAHQAYSLREHSFALIRFFSAFPPL